MDLFRKIAAPVISVIQNRWRVRRRLGERASVALLFAISCLAILLAISTAIDMSRLTTGRSALQRAVDNAALAAAAAYSLNTSGYQALALTVATTSFCDQTSSIAGGFTIVSSGTANGMTVETCGANGNGPSVSAVIGGYKPGTTGAASGSGCTATNTVSTGYECGFVVTVTASATMTPSLSLFSNKTVAVTAVALNPFLILSNALSATLNASAYNNNSIWVYPLLLNANGQPDFSSNPGALPSFNSAYPQDAAPVGCNDNPLTTSCGNYTMIADTAYVTQAPSYLCTASSPCEPNGGSGAEFVNGVVINPASPTAVITATTPIGVAMESIAGGSQSYGYGNQVGATGCYDPAAAIYGTVAQVFANVPGSSGGYFVGDGTDNPALPWATVTHWFFSSYLANTNGPLPPSEGEILSQSYSTNEDIQSVGKAAANNVYSPTLAVCAPNKPSQSPNDELQNTFYPTTGQTNRSLFIIEQAAGSSYEQPSATNPSGSGYGNPNPNAANSGYLTDDTQYYWAPSSTPGQQYAALSCQSYGTNIFTFYWNDMGGSTGYGDTYDYGNGSLQVKCSGPSFVVLIG